MRRTRVAQGPRGCRIPGRAAGQWAERGEGRRECWGVRSVPPRSPLRCDLGKAPPSQEEGAGRQPQRQGHLLLPHPCLHRGTHLEGLQEQGADLRGWGPPREGKPCQPPADGACLPGCPGDRRGGGGSVGGENLAFKGTPPGSKLGPRGGGPHPPTPLQLTCPAQEPFDPTLAPRHLWAPPHQPPPRFKGPHASSSPRSPSSVLTGRHPAGTPRVLPGSEGVVDLQPRLQRLQ